MTDLPADTIRIGSCTVVPSLNEVRRNEAVERVEPKAMDVLVLLARNGGEVCSRSDILDAVWPEAVVSEDVLNRSVSNLRKALDDDARSPVYIETIPKRGYRLIADVDWRVRGDSVPTEAPTFELGHRSEDSDDSGTSGREDPPALVTRPMLITVVVILAVASLWTFIDGARDGRPTVPRPVTSIPGIESRPSLSPDASRTAYTRVPADDDGSRVFVRLVDAESEIQLTSGPGSDRSPTWSPNGSRIAFQRYGPEGCEIRVIPSLGGSESRLTSCDESLYADLVFSPDGTRLVFNRRSSAETPFALYAVSTEPSAPVQLTYPSADVWGDHDPSFSPDGSHLAYVRSRSEGMQELFVLNVETGEERQLTEDTRNILGVTWSPDGETVIFSSNRMGPFMLWSIDRAGGSAQALSSSLFGARFPDVSPTTGRMVFARGQSDVNIYQVTLPGLTEEADQIEAGATARATGHTAFQTPWSSSAWDLHPHISSNGSAAFVSNRSGSYEIWVADSAGTARPLTEFSGPYTSRPRWHPANTQLVFVGRPDGNADLYAVDVTDGQIQRLTNTPYDELAPSWSADGKSLLFTSNAEGKWTGRRLLLSERQVDGLAIDRAVGLTMSRDGEWVYYARFGENGLWRRRVNSREEELVTGHLDSRDWGSFALSGGDVYYYRRRSGVMKLNPETGSEVLIIEPTSIVPGNDPALTISPDGSTLLFGQIDRSERDIYLVENVDVLIR